MKRVQVLAVALSFLLAACTGSSGPRAGHVVERSPASRRLSNQPITLTVWDQEVRAAQEAEITKLNREFENKHPNVTIERVARSFVDLKGRLQGAVSGGQLPDVVQVNQGWSDMGQLVRSHLLRPLDDYARLYRWRQRFSPSLIDFNSFSRNARQFGQGSLFGLAQEGEMVGVYYNKKKLRELNQKIPNSLGRFESELQVAKHHGELPIQFGNLDKFPGIHEFQELQDQFTPEEELRDLVLGRSDASFETKQNLAAASKLRDWMRKGYFPRGFESTGYDDAWKAFTQGQGLFLITGTWLAGDLDRAMPGNVGFFLMPPLTARAAVVATGGEGLAFAITSHARNADAAAAYIDFLTSPRAERIIVQAGGLPAMSPLHLQAPRNSSLHDIFRAWSTVSKRNGLVPYLDYSTPTFYGVVTSAVENLLSGLYSPHRFLQSLQQNYSTFQDLR
jgi:raffinose/stachyose/melibiose transport system substrate-binding protein